MSKTLKVWSWYYSCFYLAYSSGDPQSYFKECLVNVSINQYHNAVFQLNYVPWIKRLANTAYCSRTYFFHDVERVLLLQILTKYVVGGMNYQRNMQKKICSMRNCLLLFEKSQSRLSWIR